MKYKTVLYYYFFFVSGNTFLSIDKKKFYILSFRVDKIIIQGINLGFKKLRDTGCLGSIVYINNPP